MPDTSPSGTRALLNASEARLVASSRGTALTGASPAELRKKVARARALRDKWRDVHARQRRGTQQARRARGTAANERSREKSDLFDQVLARFEARLERVMASAAPAAPRGKPAPTGKPVRTRTHRRTRAQTKRMLADERSGRESARVRSAQAERPPMQTRQRPPKARSARGGTKTKKGKGRAPASVSKPRDTGKAGRTRGQSQSAATRQRLAMSGRTTRVRGHVQARGQRAQARRDRRG